MRKAIERLGWVVVIFGVGPLACTERSENWEIRLSAVPANKASDGLRPEATSAGTEKTKELADLETIAVASPMLTQVAAATNTTSTAAFVGIWNSATQKTNTTCGSKTPISDVLGKTITWAAGATGHVTSELVGKCVLDAKVTGSVALAGEQVCNDNGITYTVGGTFTIQSDGTAYLAEHALVTGNGVTCTGTLSGTFTRLVQ